MRITLVLATLVALSANGASGQAPYYGKALGSFHHSDGSSGDVYVADPNTLMIVNFKNKGAGCKTFMAGSNANKIPRDRLDPTGTGMNLPISYHSTNTSRRFQRDTDMFVPLLPSVNNYFHPLDSFPFEFGRLKASDPGVQSVGHSTPFNVAIKPSESTKMQYSEPTLQDEGIRINLNTSPVGKPETFGATKGPAEATTNADLNAILNGLAQSTTGGKVSPTTSLASAETSELTTADNVETSPLTTSSQTQTQSAETSTEAVKTTAEAKSSALPTEEKKEDQRLSVEVVTSSRRRVTPAVSLSSDSAAATSVFDILASRRKVSTGAFRAEPTPSSLPVGSENVRNTWGPLPRRPVTTPTPQEPEVQQSETRDPSVIYFGNRTKNAAVEDNNQSERPTGRGLRVTWESGDNSLYTPEPTPGPTQVLTAANGGLRVILGEGARKAPIANSRLTVDRTETARKQTVTAVTRRTENGIFSFVLGGGQNRTSQGSIRPVVESADPPAPVGPQTVSPPAEVRPVPSRFQWAARPASNGPPATNGSPASKEPAGFVDKEGTYHFSFGEEAVRTLPPIRQDITYPSDYFERRSNDSAPAPPPVETDSPTPTPQHIKPGDKLDGGVLRIALGAAPTATSQRPEKAENLIETPTAQWGSVSSRFTFVPDPRDRQRATATAASASIVPTTQATPSATFGPQFDLPDLNGEQLVTVRLPDGFSLHSFDWMGVYDHCEKQVEGKVVIPETFVGPREALVTGIRGWVYGANSADIHIANCNTLLVSNFTFLGHEDTGAFFYVGIGEFPNNIQQKVQAYVQGETMEKPLGTYRGQDVIVRFPSGWRTFDVDWVSVFNPRENKSYGHALLPKYAVPPCDVPA